MTTEERTPTTEDRLDDIAARLAKLEALLGDRHVSAALEGMRFDGYAREHLDASMRRRAEKDSMFSGDGEERAGWLHHSGMTEEDFAAIKADNAKTAALEGMRREGELSGKPTEEEFAYIVAEDAKTAKERAEWLRELLGEMAALADGGFPPIVVRLTGDATADAAALEAADAKRSDLEIGTGRSPGLIAYEPSFAVSSAIPF